MDSNQLAHYGVLGMKWGVRRAKKLEAKIAKNRKRTSGQAEGRAVEKRYQSKIDKIRRKQSNFGGAIDRVKKMSTGKAVASSMLMGTYGTLKYQQARASGAKRGEAYLSTIGHRFMNNVTMGLYGTYESRKKN